MLLDLDDARLLESADDPAGHERLREIVVLGCGLEQSTPRFLAIDVPPDVSVFRVYELLERDSSRES